MLSFSAFSTSRPTSRVDSSYESFEPDVFRTQDKWNQRIKDTRVGMEEFGPTAHKRVRIKNLKYYKSTERQGIEERVTILNANRVRAFILFPVVNNCK